MIRSQHESILTLVENRSNNDFKYDMAGKSTMLTTGPHYIFRYPLTVRITVKQL